MFVKEFREIRKEEIETAGGKGANLGEMTAAGIPVPDGWVLTSEAYFAYLKENQLTDLIREKLGQAGRDREKAVKAAAFIRKRILEGVIPEDVKKALTEGYGRLAQEPGKRAKVAVRSSATAEDLADASFAGQQETYLNVCGEEELLCRVKECYASLFAERAVIYRMCQGYDRKETALAVVVQRMVESDTSGVLFTKDPSNQKGQEIKINASYGLGESVVSGRVTPDEYICNRKGTVVRSLKGSKETEIVSDSHGTREIPVAKERRNREALSHEEIRKLVEAALKVEAHYGFPVDIEWAIKDGSIYILQARAITTLHGEQESPNGEYDRIEIGKVKGRIKKLMTFMLEKNPFAYYPLDYDLSMILGFKKEEILKEAGIVLDMEMHMDDNGVMVLPSGKLGVTKEITGIRKTIASWMDGEENKREGKRHLKENEEFLSGLEKEPVEQYSLKECGEHFQKIWAVMEDNAYARFRYAVFPAMLVGRKIGRALKKVDRGLSPYDLLGNLEYKTLMINRDLEKLAACFAADETQKEDILAGECYESIIRKHPEAEGMINSFLAKNGHKSDFNCYCLIARSWNEDKDRLLKVVRPVVLAAKEGIDLSKESENKEKYDLLLQSMRKAAGEGRMRRLEALIDFYRFSHVYREETQYLWESAFEESRRVYRRISSLLMDSLDDSGDLMYLFYRELLSVCQSGGLNEEQLLKIRLRKEYRPLSEKTWEKSKLAVLKTYGEQLRGIGGSSGEALGKVCVVTGPDEFYKLGKGDVLVCKYTDPEWTPLFTLAAAVVSDTGGSLSHAAIVAREYGIPAVLGTGNATGLLKDGDRVLVDGKKGVVRKIE